MRAAPQKLYELTRQRVIQDLRPFPRIRSRPSGGAGQYRDAGGVCGLLLAVTAFGMIGLTLYWVAQRRRQIGMRRALGARRIDILLYFQTENLLIAGCGCILGIALGLPLNAWLLMRVEGLTRMNPALYLRRGADRAGSVPAGGAVAGAARRIGRSGDCDACAVMCARLRLETGTRFAAGYPLP